MATDFANNSTDTRELSASPSGESVEYESTDSRKRRLEDDVELGATAKRTNLGTSGGAPAGAGAGDDSKYILKLLIPSIVAGAIIGKSGQTIVQLQRDSGANIKLSKSNDFYPGTTERVVLVTAGPESLKFVASFVAEKVKEAPSLAAKSGDNSAPISSERSRQAKVLVPNSTAGLIIGKNGSTIRQMMEVTGARIQISQKSDSVSLQERVATVTGDTAQIAKATSLLIEKVQEDPQSGSCTNISYAQFAGPVANANPTGSPFAIAVSHDNNNMVVGAKPQLAAMAPSVAAATGLPATSMAPSLAALANYGSPASRLCNTSDLAAISAAVNTLANYGYGATPSPTALLGMGGTGHALSGAALISGGNGGLGGLRGAPPSMYEAAFNGLAMGDGGLAGVSPAAGMLGSLGSFGGLATFGDMMAGAPKEATPAMGGGGGGMVSGGGGGGGGKDTSIEIEVPETLVGAILGKGGKTLVEFQNCSGAKIQISKKGEYVPGTRNRKVTITGGPPAAQAAHYLITQRVSQEEQNRALKGTT